MSNILDLAEYLDDEIDLEISESEDVEQYRKIIRAALAKWLINLKAGEVKLNSVSDLKLLIEVDKMLRELK